VKKRRLEREREKDERDQEQEMMQREKEAEYFREWEKQEDTVCVFHCIAGLLSTHLHCWWHGVLDITLCLVSIV